MAITPEQLFSWASTSAMLGWLILIFLPRRWPALLFVPRYLIPFGLSLLYAGLALAHIFTVEGGGFGSLDEVAKLFTKKEVLLAGWVHYLAFDLFIGGWIAVEADKLGLARLIQAPILVATFMLGPLGLALFLTMRAGYFAKERAAA
ncbi:ABA4-like family protein [Alterisphingorhabdus coralli]|uniref:ABA4-like family protein n=1 Tax=Alterisphingorhabdus coralli TaxID=3071408 RepID=A0AA97I264_9SPHN|nr:ABA4-like family protein [Parasphingorhabdus sp. SCSIO 66989]WOE75918.1 ABA4-like family protein [Parasphingorhabdus sp. SCSIO 66989]